LTSHYTATISLIITGKKSLEEAGQNIYEGIATKTRLGSYIYAFDRSRVIY